MLLNMQFDPEASKIAGKLIFSCPSYELRQEEITQLKKDKLVRYIQEELLPEKIPCQILMFLEHPTKAKIICFNPNFIMPESIFENYFLNQDIIEQCKKNGGFRLEFLLPLDKKGIKIDFSYES